MKSIVCSGEPAVAVHWRTALANSAMAYYLALYVWYKPAANGQGRMVHSGIRTQNDVTRYSSV